VNLNAHLWEQLHEHGVTEAHLAMLLRLLQVQRSGSWAWHYVNGQLTHCDVSLVIPARGYEVNRISEALLGREPVR
jgi:hypothetical protein